MLITVFPSPIDLYGSEGKVQAKAKWIGIQWDREEGKSNRIIYGIKPNIIQDGFEFNETTDGLEQALQNTE